MENIKFDYLISDALLYSGDANIPPKKGSIGIRNDMMFLTDADAEASTTVNGNNLICTPGFIDIHNHSDHALLKEISLNRISINANSSFENYLRQGVTTIVTGNCGEGITDVGNFKDFLSKKQPGTNVAHLLPYHSWLADSARNGFPRQKILEKNVKEGTMGISLAFDSSAFAQITANDILYNLTSLKGSRNIIVVHVRNESASQIIPSIEEAIYLGQILELPVHLSQFRVYNPLNGLQADAIIELLFKARASGLNITASQNPFTSIAAPPGDYLLDHLISNLPGDFSVESLDRASKVTYIFQSYSPEIFSLILTRKEGYKEIPLEEYARNLHLDPAQAFYSLCTENPDQAYIFANIMGENVLCELMHPPFVATSSNGSIHSPGSQYTHPRSYYTFPKKLGEYALQKRIVSLEQAIASMTSLPAKILGLKNRGFLKNGFKADIVLIDPEKIKKFDYGKINNRFAEGIEYLFINGKLIIKNGILSSVSAGQFLSQNN